MPLLSSGVYVDNGEKSYEAESAYYLNFQITSALFSIEQIMNKPTRYDGMLKNKFQHCHFYCDHLIFSLGQIVNRFNEKEKESEAIRNRKKANKLNFGFSEEEYPILSNNQIRNTIEHIDEHNQKVIDKYLGVGGFNIIDEDTDEEIAIALTKSRKAHPYTLNLLTSTIQIMRNDHELNLDLNQLRNELIRLQESARLLLSLTSEELWRSL